MTYVSFVEIFYKSVIAFGPKGAGFEEKKAYNYATLTFFCGVVFMKVSDTIKLLPPPPNHKFFRCVH